MNKMVEGRTMTTTTTNSSPASSDVPTAGEEESKKHHTQQGAMDGQQGGEPQSPLPPNPTKPWGTKKLSPVGKTGRRAKSEGSTLAKSKLGGGGINGSNKSKSSGGLLRGLDLHLNNHEHKHSPTHSPTRGKGGKDGGGGGLACAMTKLKTAVSLGSAEQFLHVPSLTHLVPSPNRARAATEDTAPSSSRGSSVEVDQAATAVPSMPALKSKTSGGNNNKRTSVHWDTAVMARAQSDGSDASVTPDGSTTTTRTAMAPLSSSMRTSPRKKGHEDGSDKPKRMSVYALCALDEGEKQMERGDARSAKEELTTAIRALKDRYGSNDETVAVANGRLGDVAHVQGNLVQALRHYDDAIAIYRLDDDGCTRKGHPIVTDLERHEKVCPLLLKKAHVYFELNQSALVAKVLLEAIDAVKKMEGIDSDLGTDVLLDIGNKALELGCDAVALSAFEQATEKKTAEEAAAEGLDFPSMTYSMGLICQRKGDNDCAMDHYRAAFETKKATLGPHPELAAIQRQMGYLHLLKSNYEDALRCFDEALLIMRDTVFQFEDAFVVTEKLAYIDRRLGRPERVIERYQFLLEYCLREYDGDENHEEVADVYHKLGKVCFEQGRKRWAIKYFKKEGKIRMEIKSDPGLIFQLHLYIGSIYRTLGDDDDALRHFEEGVGVLAKCRKDTSCNRGGGKAHGVHEFEEQLKLCEKRVASMADSPRGKKEHVTVVDFAGSVGDMGDAFMRREVSYDYAIVCYRSATRQLSHDAHGREAIRAKRNLGRALSKAGRDDEAIKTLEEVLDEQARLGRDAMEVTATVNALGHAHLAQGSSVTAAKLFQQVLETQRAKLTDLDPACLETRTNLGLAYMGMGFVDKAVKELEQVVSFQRKSLGQEHVDVANTLEILGDAHNQNRDYGKALKVHEECLVMRRKLLGDGDPLVGKSLTNCAVVNLGRQHYVAAHKLCLEALSTFKKAALSRDHPYMQTVKATTLQLDKELSVLEGERREHKRKSISAR